jgi:hypothetical protein
MQCESRDRSPTIEVRCDRDGDGYRCRVTVGDDPGASEHTVAVSASSLATLAPGADDPEELVCASFGFLLEREPPESILRDFDLRTIGRYFPEYDAEIRARMGGLPRQ